MTFRVTTDTYRIIKLALPIMAQSILFTSMSIIDTIMVGYIGTEELAGMGLATSIMLVFLSVVYSSSNSVSVIVAQNKHFKNTLKLIVTNGLVLSLTLSFFIFSIIKLFNEDIILLFWGEEDYAYKAIDYLNIISYTILASAIIQVYIGLLNALGDTFLTFLISASGVVSNIFFSYFLVFGIADMDGYGIIGAALGSILSKLVEIGVILFFLLKKYNGLYLDFDKFNYKCKSFRELLRIGGAQAINALLWAASINLYTLIIAFQGKELVASSAVISSITNLAHIAYWGIAIAAGIVISEALGKKEYERATTISRLCIILSLVFALLLAALLYLLNGFILSFYPELSQRSIDFVDAAYSIVLFTIVIRSLSTVNIVGTLRSGGDNRFIITIDVVAAWFFGIPLCYLILFHTDLPLFLVFAAPMVEDMVKAVLSTFRVIGKKWQRTINVF
ncbi:multidrug efflux protein NorA [Xenorhabdus stockiae]|uniref:Multidrug-efflux transporter n=1 Tax=Xenorhabdus stockiae TaxID=351614 RepID=A0A2D0KKU1_9GAMM|nr:MATE family efflux transporter [Xenorhabdus stockiae]PHM64016.1 multidrug efflux protein NorA [Xenorhabdus stockiae]PHM64385.1 multidrug efflux protein NorA [Xenorhabdus stockiae]